MTTDEMHSDTGASDRLLALLEAEWEIPTGFLGSLREGRYSQDFANRLLLLLNGIEAQYRGMPSIPKRAVSLLWYIPTFMSWQRERVAEKGGSITALICMENEVIKRLETILGVP